MLRGRTEVVQRNHVELDEKDLQPRPSEEDGSDEFLEPLPLNVDDVEDAGDTAPKRGGCAYVKHMLPSLVTGGYWAQAPNELCAVMPQTTCDVQLRVGASTWEVVWLLRPSGAGLSGGWRGFAVDQRLCVGDAVVFQQRDPARKRGALAGLDPTTSASPLPVLLDACPAES